MNFFCAINGQYETLLSTCIKQFTPPPHWESASYESEDETLIWEMKLYCRNFVIQTN